MRPAAALAARVRPALAAALVLVAAGCAAPAHRAQPFSSRILDSDERVGRCARLLEAFETAVRAAGARDGGPAPVAGYPQLRADRLSAALMEADPPAAIAMARSLDAQGRAAELARLPAPARAGLAARASVPPDAVGDALEDCAGRLLAADEARGELPRTLAVADDYDTWKRVAGLYWLTRLPFAAGVRRYQDETRAAFVTPLEQLPVRGALRRYVPAAVAGLADAELAQRHAPVLEVDVASDDDRVGRVSLAPDGLATVDAARPVAYVRAAATLVDGRLLRQLVYTFWFPSRPRAGALDLLGGRLDGLVWRVTLDAAGEPWVYDTIHPCGCYHQFFPGPAARLRPQPATLDETIFVPQRVPGLGAGERVVLRVASGTHYLQRVTLAAAPAGEPYALEDEALLRVLRHPGGGVRSLYGADGIVPGTGRGERWLFWPMGVREAGAMRQWGRHATAFVGRRHFDDPRLLDRAFEHAPQ